jgi:hypothetical protein
MPVFRRKKMCSECPFRANSAPGWLGGVLTIEDLEVFVRCLGEPALLICHKAIRALHRKGAGTHEVLEQGQHCVGLARYALSCAKRSRDPAMAAFQKALENVPDQPVIPAGKLREHHSRPLTIRRITRG